MNTPQPASESPQADASPLLDVRHLSKRFGDVVAVNDLSFTVAAGQIVAMLGPNGAGKTTSLKCIVGLLRPQAGQITLAGQPARTPQARAALGWVPEVPYAYELLTIWEHMQFVALAYRLPASWEERAAALLRQFDLWEKRSSLASGLSKGMRQKLVICLALLHQPRLFLFDEPLVGLDPPAQRELREIILQLRQAGAGVLISTHMLESAERLCDQALVMHKGRQVAAGSLAELREQFHLPTNTPLEDVFFEAIR